MISAGIAYHGGQIGVVIVDAPDVSGLDFDHALKSFRQAKLVAQESRPFGHLVDAQGTRVEPKGFTSGLHREFVESDLKWAADLVQRYKCDRVYIDEVTGGAGFYARVVDGLHSLIPGSTLVSAWRHSIYASAKTTSAPAEETETKRPPVQEAIIAVARRVFPTIDDVSFPICTAAALVVARSLPLAEGRAETEAQAVPPAVAAPVAPKPAAVEPPAVKPAVAAPVAPKPPTTTARPTEPTICGIDPGSHFVGVSILSAAGALLHRETLEIGHEAKCSPKTYKRPDGSTFIKNTEWVISPDEYRQALLKICDIWERWNVGSIALEYIDRGFASHGSPQMAASRIKDACRTNLLAGCIFTAALSWETEIDVQLITAQTWRAHYGKQKGRAGIIKERLVDRFPDLAQSDEHERDAVGLALHLACPPQARRAAKVTASGKKSKNPTRDGNRQAQREAEIAAGCVCRRYHDPKAETRKGFPCPYRRPR